MILRRVFPAALAFAAGLSLLAVTSALAVNARIYNLGDSAISVAVTNQVITSSTSAQGQTVGYVDRLEGASAITFQATFAYGSSGGTSIKADVETSMDSGVSWLPLCRFAFTTASAQKVATVSGLTPRLTAAVPTTLSDDACFDGTIGNLLRTKITVVGTYVGAASLSIRAAVR